MLNRRHLISSVLNNSKEELVLRVDDEAVIQDGLTASFRRPIAWHKGLVKDKTYIIKYNYSFTPLEVSQDGNRNDIAVRFLGGFGYGYSWRLNMAPGIMPPDPVYEGVVEQVITCTATQPSDIELLRMNVEYCKVICRIWNVSLTEV